MSQRGQPCREFGEGERFDQIIVGAGVESRHAIGDPAQRRQHQDRRGHARRAPPLEHLDPVDPRHHAIEHDDVECLNGAQVKRVLAGRDGRHDMTEFAESVRNEPGGLGIILGEQDAHPLISVLVAGGFV